MNDYRIIKIQEHHELKNYAANWFHEKWNIPLEAYLESIDECMKNKTPVPQWYIVIIGDKIVGGLGVIENDFHNRKDLTSNVCAVYVEDDYRCQGIAGKMLNYVCDDMREKILIHFILLQTTRLFMSVMVGSFCVWSKPRVKKI